MEKYGRAAEATVDNITRRMRFARLIFNPTDRYSEYIIIFFHGKNGYAKAPRVYADISLSVFLFICV
jgi:hypothetical protein